MKVLRLCLHCRRLGFNPWVGKIPWKKKWQLTPVFLVGEFHGQRNLVGYSPWSRRVGHDSATNTVVKNPPVNAGDIRDMGLILGSGRSPGGGHGNPLQYSCFGESLGQRTLVGYSPWGRRVRHDWKWLSMHTYMINRANLHLTWYRVFEKLLNVS